MWNHWQHSCPHQLWHLLYLLYDLYTSKLLPIMTWYLLPIFIIFIKQMYTNGYLVDLESRGGWNELMAHKLIEETLNAQVAWRNPECKNLIYKSKHGAVSVGSAWKILSIIARSLWSFPRCNFPRCNWLQRKKKWGAVWFFEAKDLVDQKKNI